MKPCRVLFMLGLIGLGFSAAAQEEMITAGPFSVPVSGKLSVAFDGATLVSGDRCVGYMGLTSEAPMLLDTTQGKVLRSGNTLTLLQESDTRYFRREVLVTPEAVHITFEIRAFGPLPSTHMEYDLITPAETLEGAPFTATTGDGSSNPSIAEGRFERAAIEPFKPIASTCRYMVVKRPSGAFTADFNPDGPWRMAGTGYGYNSRANPYRAEKEYRWMMVRAYARQGNLFCGKIVIRPGATPYAEIHPVPRVAYTCDFPMPLALNFSESESDARFKACGADPKPDRKYRWATPIAIVRREAGGFLYRDFATTAGGAGEGVFEMEQRDGLYLVTLNVHDSDEAVGPFSVAGPEGALFKNVALKPGEYWIRSAPLRFRNGKAQLRFSGKWKVNALSLKTLLYDTEDFVVGRSFWNMAVAGEQNSLPPM